MSFHLDEDRDLTACVVESYVNCTNYLNRNKNVKTGTKQGDTWIIMIRQIYKYKKEDMGTGTGEVKSKKSSNGFLS